MVDVDQSQEDLRALVVAALSFELKKTAGLSAQQIPLKRDLGMDSIGAVNVAFSLEEELGIEIELVRSEPSTQWMTSLQYSVVALGLTPDKCDGRGCTFDDSVDNTSSLRFRCVRFWPVRSVSSCFSSGVPGRCRSGILSVGDYAGALAIINVAYWELADVGVPDPRFCCSWGYGRRCPDVRNSFCGRRSGALQCLAYLSLVLFAAVGESRRIALSLAVFAVLSFVTLVALEVMGHFRRTLPCGDTCCQRRLRCSQS